MSIHFRSRISNQQLKPITNKTGSGWCCGTSQVVSNRTLCPGGYFILGGTNSTFCPTSGPCVSSLIGTDGACCYWDTVDGVYKQFCVGVNSSIECFEKNKGTDEGLYPSFTLGGSCLDQGGDVTCNGARAVDKTDLQDLNSISSIVAQENIIGNCCGNGECKKVIESSCFETWIPPTNSGLYACDTDFCDDILKPTGRIPPTISSNNLQSSTKPLLALPEIGKYYQGGIYVGIFKHTKKQ